jgi:hypothetical protein
MHRLRKVSAFILLLTFTLSITNLDLIAVGLISSNATSGGVPCPMHAIKCCCPEKCNVTLKPSPKPGCYDSHAAGNAAKNSRSSPAPASATCFLKAGCGDKHHPATPGSSLKPFLPWVLDECSLTLAFSLFVLSLYPSILPGYSLPLFHPPRTL